MRSGQKCFCCKSNLCGKTCFFKFFAEKRKKKDFRRTSKNSDFFEKGYDDRFFFFLKKNPITENQKRNSWRDLLHKWFLLSKKKKVNLILFERTPSKKIRKGDETKKNDRTKKVLQREMTNSKMSDFSTTKNEK